MIRGFDLPQLFLSSTGRVGRLPFAFAVAALLVLLGLWRVLVPAPAWLDALVGFLLFFSGACVLSKRLHDRGRSGWLAGPVLLAFMLAWPHPEGVLDFLGGIVILWAAIELGLLPGEAGANRYGPNPEGART